MDASDLLEAGVPLRQSREPLQCPETDETGRVFRFEELFVPRLSQDEIADLAAGEVWAMRLARHRDRWRRRRVLIQRRWERFRAPARARQRLAQAQSLGYWPDD